MTLLLAAVGAMAAALLELTLTPFFRFGSVQPHLVLLAVVGATVVISFDAGLVSAFVGGLALDVLAQRPLGSTAFVLLLAVAGAASVGRALGQFRPLAPVVATLVLTLPYSLLLLAAFDALQAPIAVSDPLGTLIPTAVYDVAVMILIGPAAVTFHDRRARPERLSW